MSDTNDTTQKLNIYQRINAIQKDVKYIQKDTKVQGYKAVTHDMVTARLRDSCVKHGVLIVPNEKKCNISEVGLTSSGTKIIRYEGKYTISFINIDDPEDKIKINIRAHANDHGDKAPGKCLSYAVKNAMLKVFLLETGESDESRVEPERRAKRKISKEQVKWVQKRKNELGIDDDKFQKVLNNMRVASIEDLNESSLRDIEIRFNAQEKANQKEKKNANSK